MILKIPLLAPAIDPVSLLNSGLGTIGIGRDPEKCPFWLGP